jgi:hypothetical protein
MAGSFEFTAKLEGLGTVTAMLDEAIAAVSPPLLTEAVHKGAELMAEALKNNINVGKADDGAKHPGQLRDSVGATPLGPSTFAVGPDLEAGNVKDYARMEQLGGQIHAVNFPVMVFMSAKYGGKVAAVTVTHEGKDYMGKGFIEGEAPADLAIRAAIAAHLPKA